MGHIHTDKHGKSKPICELDTAHLKNIIRCHKRIAKEGLTIRRGGGSTPEDFWYDEDEYYGKDALDILQTDAYITELNSRK